MLACGVAVGQRSLRPVSTTSGRKSILLRRSYTGRSLTPVCLSFMFISFTSACTNLDELRVPSAPGVGSGCTIESLSFGSSRVGSLTASDCASVYQIGARADVYRFTGSAGRATRIEMVAGFDAYLVLIGPSGLMVATDDDSLSGSDALISLNLPTSGSYLVEATSYDTSGQTQGNYSIVVR
jgi:hypothetical protein